MRLKLLASPSRGREQIRRRLEARRFEFGHESRANPDGAKLPHDLALGIQAFFRKSEQFLKHDFVPVHAGLHCLPDSGAWPPAL